MKMNETDLLMKTWMCNTLGSLRRLVVVWKQFHDCSLLKLPVKYYPEQVSEKKPSVGLVGYFTTEELHIQAWCVSQELSEKETYQDIVSQKQILCDLSTSFAVAT